MTRSEERMRAGTERVETGRARLRKYVITESVSQTVPLSHEVIRVEREPVTDPGVKAGTGGPTISEEQHEVVLHAERPVVQTEVVPIERVRLDIETVTGQRQVSEDLRREEIEIDGDSTTGSTR